MSAEKKARVRDRRKPGWFRVDDEIIEVYGPEIGVHGIAVYAAICRYAGKDESGYPSLRTLCKKLKIGRTKLLSTLAELQTAGLIDIEPGDRATVSVYTLLDVPKAPARAPENTPQKPPKEPAKPAEGGSNQDHVEAQGGPNQDHRWSQPGPRGGPNQDRNQTKYEPDIFNQREKKDNNDNVAILDSVTRSCTLSLRKIKSWNRSELETASLVAELRNKFPDADAAKVCDDLEWNERFADKPSKNIVNSLRIYFSKASEWTKQKEPGVTRRRKKVL